MGTENEKKRDKLKLEEIRKKGINLNCTILN